MWNGEKWAGCFFIKLRELLSWIFGSRSLIWAAKADLGRESCGRRGLLVRLGRTRSIGDPSDGRPEPKTCLQASLTQVFGSGLPPS